MGVFLDARAQQVSCQEPQAELALALEVEELYCVHHLQVSLSVIDPAADPEREACGISYRISERHQGRPTNVDDR